MRPPRGFHEREANAMTGDHERHVRAAVAECERHVNTIAAALRGAADAVQGCALAPGLLATHLRGGGMEELFGAALALHAKAYENYRRVVGVPRVVVAARAERMATDRTATLPGGLRVRCDDTSSGTGGHATGIHNVLTERE